MEYKIAMHMHGAVWNVMDIEKNYDRALKILESYRKALPKRKFRLEKHVFEVLDV